MSKQEYREGVHKILDLVMDIQEQKGYPVASFEIRPSTNNVAVGIYRTKGELCGLYVTNYPPAKNMDTPKEIIEALEIAKQEMKA